MVKTVATRAWGTATSPGPLASQPLREALPWSERFTFDLTETNEGSSCCSHQLVPSDRTLTIMTAECRSPSVHRELLANATMSLERIGDAVWWTRSLDAIGAMERALEARVERLEAVIHALADQDEGVKAAIASVLGAKTVTVDPRNLEVPFHLSPQVRWALRVRVTGPIPLPLIVHIDLRGLRLDARQ